MNTVYEVLVVIGPKLEDQWNIRDDILDGAKRAGVIVAECLNDTGLDPILKLKTVDVIMSAAAFPNNLEGLKQYWKDLIVANRP